MADENATTYSIARLQKTFSSCGPKEEWPHKGHAFVMKLWWTELKSELESLLISNWSTTQEWLI